MTERHRFFSNIVVLFFVFLLLLLAWVNECRNYDNDLKHWHDLERAEGVKNDA